MSSQINEAINDALERLIDAAIEDSWSGGGAPEDIPAKAQELVDARENLQNVLNQAIFDQRRTEGLHHEIQRRDLWVQVAARTAGASNCHEKTQPGAWADQVLAEFDRKFPKPARESV